MLSLDERIIVFKTLAICKIVYLDCHSKFIDRNLKKTQKRSYGTPHVQKLVAKYYVTVLKMMD